MPVTIGIQSCHVAEVVGYSIYDEEEGGKGVEMGFDSGIKQSVGSD